MKKILILMLIVMTQFKAFTQSFELELDSTYLFPHFMVETKNHNYLMSSWETNGNSVQLRFSIINALGKVIENNIIERNDSSYTYPLKIIVNDSEYVCVGYQTFLNKGNLANLRILTLSHNLAVKKDLIFPMTTDKNLINLEACEHKDGHCITWALIDQFGNQYSYIRCIDKNGNSVLNNDKGVGIFASILSIKEKLIALAGTNLYVLDDSLNTKIKSSSIFPFVGNQGSLRLLNDSTYIFACKYKKSQPTIENIGIMKFQYPFKNLKQTFHFGKKDTLNIPALGTKVDFKDKNNIYLGGLAHYVFDSEASNWFMLANLDADMKPRWEKYYGGDANYYLRGILATSDGGCIMYGTKYYYNTTRKAVTYLLKVNAQGQLLAENGVPLPEENIKIFPNPSSDFFNISASDSEEKLQIQCFDHQGRNVYQCDFQGFMQINASEWARGLYAYVIKNEKGVTVKMGKMLVK